MFALSKIQQLIQGNKKKKHISKYILQDASMIMITRSFLFLPQQFTKLFKNQWSQDRNAHDKLSHRSCMFFIKVHTNKYMNYNLKMDHVKVSPLNLFETKHTLVQYTKFSTLNSVLIN